ncbi:ABC transporter substrate-binding protein [Acidiferrimicrobium sp. IK]|uniref:ABC transporter substrate-binding protein n=1 Tax=Acidiferrimicrobium sp. IK TaxID=2871700 RepID=UPI0021CB784C|nr:ABC transporter substrate-binding protein [Acidiferrimicrobium sp. IK]
MEVPLGHPYTSQHQSSSTAQVRECRTGDSQSNSEKGKSVGVSQQDLGGAVLGKRGRVFAAVASVAVGALALSACGSSGQSTTAAGSGSSSGGGSGSGGLQIANFVPFSGADASYGDLALSGCYPATYLINKAGGVLGHQLTCTSSDTRGDPQDAVPAANALVAHSSSVVAVFGPSSDEALSTEPLFQQAHIPSFLMTGDTQYDSNTDPYMWRLVPPDAAEGYAMAAWAESKGFTRAAAVFATGSQSQADGPAAISGFKKLGGQIVANVQLTPGQPSYSTEAQKVASSHPQVIFYDGSAPMSATFFAELKQLTNLPPTYVVETEEEPAWITAVSGAIGASALQSFTAFEASTPSTSTAGWQTFNQAMHNAPKNVPSINQYLKDPFTLSYYDAANLVALAMVEAHSIKPTVYNSDIMGLTEAGAGKTVVHDFATGVKDLQAGQKIQYVGALGQISLDPHHNIAADFNALTESSNPQVLGQAPTDLMVKAAG